MHSDLLKSIIPFLLVLAIFGIGCSGQSPYPPEVAEGLKTAGENRYELESVLTHYASGDDTLKLHAAYYLIANMEGHGFVTYTLHDTAGAQINFNVLDYSDYNALKEAVEKLEAQHGELDFDRNEIINDLETISSEFLINQIDYAFRAWRERPWARKLTFNQFLDYVLPYRGSNEPLERWREMFWEKYEHIGSGMTDPSDPIEAAALINDDIRSWFGFDPRFYYHPTDQSLSQMLDNSLGRCEDMTNLAIYAMRANGLAVTSDYTPYWANSGNNHAWNAIVAPDGRVIPFMGAESNPGEYRLTNKLAKVYRKTFGKQKGNLVFQKRKQEKTPRWLSGKSYKDVTSDYVEVCDLAITFKREIPDSVDIAYLCVFNSGEWKPIDWGRIENNAAIFEDFGVDIAYLPALYLNEEIVPFGAPFILHDDCRMVELRPGEGRTISARLTSTTRRKQEISTDGIARSFLKSGQEYELSYWDDGWQSLGKTVAGDGPISFDEVPEGSLYWLVATGSDSEERIFTIEDGRQVWW